MGKRTQHRYTNAATNRQNVTRQEHFARIPSVKHQRSSFDRSSGLKTAFNSGLLVPIFADEAIPGDTFSLKANVFGRLATPIHPVMENLYLDFFFFAVPLRLLWDNFQKFMGEQDNPGDSTDFEVPIMQAYPQGFLAGSMMDYMGVPPNVPDMQISAFHSRAYNLIWKEWFRDENLQDAPYITTGPGPDDPINYPIQKRGKRHDYFTSCLPWPQKGAAVEIPLGEQAPILGLGIPQPSGDGQPLWTMGTNDNKLGGQSGQAGDTRWTEGNTASGAATLTDPKLLIDYSKAENTAYADLSAATAVTINALREAFQVQRMYEKDARGGTRYTEIIRSHFGILSPDARLQRPEYIGGGSSIISINPVAQTSETQTTPQGNLSAYGTTFGAPVKFTQSFTEHSVILGLCALRADLNYQQGLERMWSRKRRFDYYWPSFAHLGEQEVFNKEIFADGSEADEKVFGYQERYAEYRYKPSRVTGRMRSSAGGGLSLDAWHLAQDFANLPGLNAEFIVEDPPIERIIAVTSEAHLILDCHFNLRCSRPMPTYSVPGLIDHF